MFDKRKHLARQKFDFFRPPEDIAIALFSLVALPTVRAGSVVARRSNL